MNQHDVKKFLTINGWVFNNSSCLWIHQLMKNNVINDAEITRYPIACFNSAVDWMNANKIAVAHTIKSYAQMITPQVLIPKPAISFSSQGIQVVTDNTLEFTIIPKPKCDCGAVKCKTTHSHWCSTQVKGNKDGR